MRTAVIISGMIRDCEVERLKYLTDFDIYACVWDIKGKFIDDDEASDPYFSTTDIFSMKSRTLDRQKINYDEIYSALCSSGAKNVHLKILDYESTIKTVPVPCQLSTIIRSVSQFYILKRAFEMIDNPEDYDLIARIRIDNNAEFPKITDESIYIDSPCKLYLKSNFAYPDEMVDEITATLRSDGFLHPGIFFGKASAMRKMCSIIDSYSDIFNSHCHDKVASFNTDEAILEIQAMLHGIKIKYILWDEPPYIHKMQYTFNTHINNCVNRLEYLKRINFNII
jgi:hypothetical protein